MLLVYPAGEIRGRPLYRDGRETVFRHEWLHNGLPVLREVNPNGQPVCNGLIIARFAVVDREIELEHEDHSPSAPDEICCLCVAAGWVSLYEYLG